MLVNRATGELCRLIAADALYAMPYAAEELHGEPDSGPQRPAAGAPVTAAEILAAGPPPMDAADARPEGDDWQGADPDGDWPATAQPGGAA